MSIFGTSGQAPRRPIGTGDSSRSGFGTPRGQSFREKAHADYEITAEKQRVFGWIDYAAKTWDRERRIIVKAEHTSKGSNPRYVVTSLEGSAQELHDEVYRARGEMENRIKEQQLHLFADRTSDHKWWANQFRLLLSSRLVAT